MAGLVIAVVQCGVVARMRILKFLICDRVSLQRGRISDIAIFRWGECGLLSDRYLVTEQRQSGVNLESW